MAQEIDNKYYDGSRALLSLAEYLQMPVDQVSDILV